MKEHILKDNIICILTEKKFLDFDFWIIGKYAAWFEKENIFLFLEFF